LEKKWGLFDTSPPAHTHAWARTGVHGRARVLHHNLFFSDH